MIARHSRAGLVGPLATSPAVPWVIAAAFVIAGLAAIRANTFLNDEGVVTWIFAGLMSESPIDMLFFAKSRPPISLLYAPIAAVGLKPFLWAHLLLAALAIPLTAMLARDFDHDIPNLPATLVALSPLYFASAASGVQNTEATIGLLAVACLLTRHWPMSAGLLMGVVAVGRIETAVFGLAFMAYAMLTPGCRRFLVGVFVFPTILALLGALYHGDLLWPLRYPSSLYSNPTIVPAERVWYVGTPRDLVYTLLALTPVIGVLAWTSFRGQTSIERTLTIGAFAFVVVLRILPVTEVIYVDASPRYILPPLPFLCLAANRAVSRWGRSWRGGLIGGGLLLGITGFALAHLDDSAASLLIAAVGLCVVAAILAFVSKRVALMTLVGASAAAMLLAMVAPREVPLFTRTNLLLGDHARQLDECVRWIGSNVPDRGVVVTDQHLLGIWLSERAPGIQVDVRHLVTPETLYEAQTLTNPATRQFDALFNTSRFFYARWIFSEEIASLPGEVFFVLRRDPSPRPRDLSAPPFDRIEWLVKGDWLGGRLIRDSRAATGGTHAP
jgi:hypothetical protein